MGCAYCVFVLKCIGFACMFSFFLKYRSSYLVCFSFRLCLAHCDPWYTVILGSVLKILRGPRNVMTRSKYLVPCHHQENVFHLSTSVQPPWAHLNLSLSLFVFFAGNISLNTGPAVQNLYLWTLITHSVWDYVPALSDFVINKSIDLLGITEIRLIMRGIFADLS